MPREITPATPPDLSSIHVASLRGKRVTEVADATLEAGEQLLRDWQDFRPIAQKLTAMVSEYVNSGKVDGPEAVRMLTSCASVTDKLSKASQSFLKASEGQSRLAVLLQGGVQKRPEARQLSEKQLAGVVLEAAKRMYQETQTCPVCAPPVIEAI